MDEKSSNPSTNADEKKVTVLVVWLALTAILCGLGAANITQPGLYYDEAVFGGLAKDFVNGLPRGQHMPNTETVMVFGHPFPLFVQSYLGAVKSWVLIPTVALFGPTLPVLRLTNVCWSAAGLLFFLLWTRRVAGLGIALTSAALLTLDPAFFFTSILDWGAGAPSLFFRFAGLFFTVRAWEKGQGRDALLAGLSFGLGLFNKIDFALLLLALAAATVVVLANSLADLVVRRRTLVALGGLGFLLGVGLLLPHVPRILAVHAPAGAGEWREKLRILQTMLDGSYFYRLMATGGRFETMFAIASVAWTPFAPVFALASAVLLMLALRGGEWRRWSVFLLLTFFCAATGLMLLPNAVRLHHALLLMPLPQWIVATAFAAAWKQWPRARAWPVLGLALLLCWQTAAIWQTQRLIRQTGGRGNWSEALDQFCREVQHRTDLTIICLDWGFNEQLLYLTDGPRLEEPVWNWINQPAARRANPPTAANLVYLFHPEDFSKFAYGAEFMRLPPPGGKRLFTQTWRDAQGQPAFYSARFVDEEPPR